MTYLELFQDLEPGAYAGWLSWANYLLHELAEREEASDYPRHELAIDRVEWTRRMAIDLILFLHDVCEAHKLKASWRNAMALRATLARHGKVKAPEGLAFACRCANQEVPPAVLRAAMASKL